MHFAKVIVTEVERNRSFEVYQVAILGEQFNQGNPAAIETWQKKLAGFAPKTWLISREEGADFKLGRYSGFPRQGHQEYFGTFPAPGVVESRQEWRPPPG